jgi:hypothetical protein
MKVAHAAEIQFEQWPRPGSGKGGIRGENALHRTLLQGKPRTPTNFEFGIAAFKGEGNGSPRHRHVFDQFRYALSGEIEYGPGQVIPEGCLAYFPEGTPYGPFKIDPKSVLLSLQFGGPSGQGFVHRQVLGDAQSELAAKGTFEKGIYSWIDAEGRKHNEDAHAAVWRVATGVDKVKMPEPRYADPILIYPQNYRWREIAPRVSQKLLGVFNERNTCASMLKIERGGTHDFDAGGQTHIVFVIDGAMSIDNGEVCQKHDGVQIEPGERPHLAAMADTTLLVYGLPVFQ